MFQATTAVGMSPFEVVYGQQYLPEETKAEVVAYELLTWDELLRQLSFNLKRAKQKVAKVANKHRKDVEFEVGDSVFL